MNLQAHQDIIHGGNFSLKKEHQSLIPPWLAPPHSNIDLSSSSSSSIFSQTQNLNHHHHHENPNPRLGPTLPGYQPPAPPAHMSATALLQKAAQMGATMTKTGSSSQPMIRTHHMSPSADSATNANNINNNISSGNFGNLNLSTCEDQMVTMTTTTAAAATTGVSTSFLHHVMNSFPSGFEGTSFEDTFGPGGILNSNNKDIDSITTSVVKGGNNEGLTRDFLGLRPLSHSDILTIASMGNCMNHDQQNQSQKQRQG